MNGQEIPEMSTSIVTVIKMLETLPHPARDRVVEHLREYIQDLEDELKWDEQFSAKQSELVTAARRAKEEISQGKSVTMDYDQL